MKLPWVVTPSQVLPKAMNKLGEIRSWNVCTNWVGLDQMTWWLAVQHATAGRGIAPPHMQWNSIIKTWKTHRGLFCWNVDIILYKSCLFYPSQALLSNNPRFNSLRLSDAYMHQSTRPSMIQVMPVRYQATIWTNAGLLLIRTLGKNFSDNCIKMQQFS